MTGISLNKKSPHFLDKNFLLNTWKDIEPFYKKLSENEAITLEEQKKWLSDRSELDAYVSENLAWRYIHFTCNTQDNESKHLYEYFINEIQPNISPYEDILNRKMLSFSYLDTLNDEGYQILMRSVRTDVKLFRQENIPLFTEIENIANKYSTITSEMTIQVEGAELTLQQASKLLEDYNREKRKDIFEKISQRRLKDQEKLDDVYSNLITLRHQVALNAGHKNFRDFMFEALCRFDYTVDDNFEFHNSIREEILPLIKDFEKERKEKLNLDVLRPYDGAVDVYGQYPLRPFEKGEGLITKTISCFNRLGFSLGEYLNLMKKKGFLDIDSRKGKAPGGYNYPLDETGVPFIFMNASGRLQDVVTLNHEGGHAIHSFMSRDLDLVYFKHTPSEVAELASMSMELISMDNWGVYFSNPDELKRARKNHLSDIIDILPWIAIIDKFQHWVYTHPTHTVEERDSEWLNIYDEFSTSEIDWTGYESHKKKLWQKQGHLFENPFYYIEYAIAQLGAIAIWRNYRKNPEKGLNNYLQALKLGHTKSIPNIYKTAGIKFDFSRKYINSLADFIKQELDEL